MAKTDNLKVGDLVKLKSGSPTMVVNSTIYEETINCIWWNPAKAEFQTTAFERSTLKKIKPGFFRV